MAMACCSSYNVFASALAGRSLAIVENLDNVELFPCGAPSGSSYNVFASVLAGRSSAIVENLDSVELFPRGAPSVVSAEGGIFIGA
jgi:hypothetical protein